MMTIADLHIHSKYSRATSPQMEVLTLDLWAKKKGIDILATGDFTHARYLKELKDNLSEDGSGLLTLKNQTTSKPDYQLTRFVLSGEIACIYSDKGKTRRLHILILAPDFAAVEKINLTLEKYQCNLKSDGRPIIGLSAKKLAQICFEANEKILVIPAHAWTPWFAIFGSKSGYDSIKECYEELSDKIFAIETGLSSDPAMNWRCSMLDDIALISNSDAHSPANIGREANVFDLEKLTYDEIYETLRNRNKKKFLRTIEFYPEEGMYHFDGHRVCGFSCSSADSVKKHKNICPACKKPLVLGVEHRVAALADREIGFKPANAIPFQNMAPLTEIISECLQKGKNTKSVQVFYEAMIKKGQSEFNILLNLDKNQIKNISNEIIAEAIDRVRAGKVNKTAGFDGQYGKITVFSKQELKEIKPSQRILI